MNTKKRSLLLFLLASNSCAILPAQAEYRVIKMGDLFSEDSIIAIHNGKQGSDVKEFTTDKVILKIEEEKCTLRDLIKSIKNGTLVQNKMVGFREYFFSNPDTLKGFRFNVCKLIAIHNVQSGNCRLEQGVEFSYETPDRE
jgi:hypothetical protein